MATLRSLLLKTAEECELGATVSALKSFSPATPFAREAAATTVEEPAAELTDLLGQLARRGLDPRLVPALLQHFDGRPLERGLVAWDVLCGTIWPADEDDVFDELREAAEAIVEIAATPREQCIDLNTHTSTALIETYALPAVKDALEEAKASGLGAIETLRRRGGKATETVMGAPFRQGITSLGQLLAHAHLPSLASLYLDYAIRTLNHVAALPLLCETMFDAAAPSRIPNDSMLRAAEDGAMTPAEHADFLEYVLYRTHAATKGLSVKGYAILEQNRLNREAKHEPLSDRFVVMQALFAPLFDDPLPSFERLDAIAKAHPLWALAWSVRLAAAADSAPKESMMPLETAQEYVGRFGHDWRSWYHAFRAATRAQAGNVPWKIVACASVGQEVLALPHDPNAWKALILLIADDDSINEVLAEVDEQLNDQSEF